MARQPSDEFPFVNLLNGAYLLMSDGDFAGAAAAVLACVPELAEMDDTSIEKVLADLSPGALRLVAAEALSELRVTQAAALGRSDN
jgi:hypothetical protein